MHVAPCSCAPAHSHPQTRDMRTHTTVLHHNPIFFRDWVYNKGCTGIIQILFGVVKKKTKQQKKTKKRKTKKQEHIVRSCWLHGKMGWQSRGPLSEPTSVLVLLRTAYAAV